MNKLAINFNEEEMVYADETAMFAMTREVLPVEVVARFTIDGEPQSKARPRFSKQNGKSRAYTPKKTKQAEQIIAWKFKESARGWRVDGKSSFGVCAIFFAGTQQRRDVDNMLKLICDGLNGVAWVDDMQVDEISGRRGNDVKENARTEVLIYRMGEKRRNQKTCIRCGTKFDVFESTKNRKYCSLNCHYEAVKENRTRVCEHCGKEYERTHARQKYCSVQCKSDALTVVRNCKGCGIEVRRPKSQVKSEVWCSKECMQKNKTHCIHGHKLTPENVYIAPGSKRKNCRTCRAEASKKRREKTRKSSVVK